MKTIIYNIGTLAGILPEGVLKLEGAQMNEVECIENAYLAIEDGVIVDFGAASDVGSGFKNRCSFSEFSYDAIFNDKICILYALHLIHLSTFQLPHTLRQNSRQRTNIIYNSFHTVVIIHSHNCVLL